ncbi:MAG TPA: cupredoxin domain-containing protein [Candidatus Dormibacteraeota bacterium]|nr:cupredoxin domain-containing protein [Candidatus Dormibacteraeota bacterium]
MSVHGGRAGWTALLLALLVTACGGGSSTSSSTSSSPASPASGGGSPAAVLVKNIAFSPTSVTIPVGGKVVWTFDDAGIPHTVTSDTDVFGSPPNGLTSGTFERVFAKPGTYAYHCDFHPQMKATVTVR